MGSKFGKIGLAKIRALANFLGVIDPKQGPDNWDNDDVKTVVTIQGPAHYQEFTTAVSALTAGGVGGFNLDIFQVGGVVENGQGIVQQVNSTDGTFQGQLSAATDWDYKILALLVQVQLSVAQALAMDGMFIKFNINQLAPICVGAQDVGGVNDLLSGGKCPFFANNIFDDQEIDTNGRVYSFGLHGGGNGAVTDAWGWPGWIPGILGNGLQVHIQNESVAHVQQMFPSPVQFQSRVYGLRFPKGTFPLAR